jgi:flavin-dependent dehydrogenase
VAAKAAIEDNVSAARLKEYERRWRGEFGRELAFGLEFRKIFSRMTDEDFNEAVAALDDPEILDMITQYGDIDRPSLLARQFFKLSTKERVWRFVKLFSRVFF